MINVNLLPQEYRRVERTPILRFVAIICGVVLSASAIGAFLYVHFVTLVEVVSDREKLDDTYRIKKGAAETSKALEKEAREYMKRRQTIEQIGKQRLVWSRKIDELADIIHNKGDTRRHQVWLSTLRTLASNKDSAGGLFIKGYSGGEIHRLSDFHLDIKNSEFFEDFNLIDNPDGSVVSFNDDRVPASAWEFDLNMRLKPFGWRNTK